MKFKSCGVVCIILLIGCSSKQSNNPKTVYQNDYLRYFMEDQTDSVPSKSPYDGVIKQAAQRYAIDENLIRAIIKAMYALNVARLTGSTLFYLKSNG